MIRACVIIPNWNGRELLGDCLDSLNKQTFRNFEIVVVDNGSSDGSVEFLSKNYPGVKVTVLKRNFGFARAINEGVKKVRSKYVVFLNNDAVVDKRWLEELIKCAELHPEVVSVNPKILNFYDRKKIDGVGISINEIGQARSIGFKEKDHGQYKDEMYIFGVTGGASLFKREQFISLGMFDENFFMYFEEVDFAWRAQFAGFKSIYDPKAVVYHKHQASSKKLPTKKEYWFFKNMTIAVIKNFPRGVLLKRWRWLKLIMVHFNTIFYQLKNGFIWPPVLTELWLVSHLPQLIRQRQTIQAGKKVPDEYFEQFLKEKKITFWGKR